MAIVLGACAPPSSPSAEQEILEALRAYLAASGEGVAAHVAVIEPEDYPPPLHSPYCFPEVKPSSDLIKAFERSSKQLSPDLLSSLNRGLERLAAKMVGTTPDPLQGLFVSRAGVDVATGRGLIYAERRAGLAGFGAYYLLEKRGRWQVIDSCVVWES